MANNRKWILLRGLARGRGHWGSFAATIQARFPQDEFEFIDLPGNGERCEELSPHSIRDFVRDLRARSRFVQAGEKFRILAVSLGAMIAVEWMREYPHEVEQAFLVCTSSANFSPFYDRFKLPRYFSVLKIAIDPRPQEKERLTLEMVINDSQRLQKEFPGMLEYSRRYPLRPVNILRQLWAASQYRFPNQAPGLVTVIGSWGDRLVDPSCSVRIAESWGLQPIMHDRAGHDIPIDAPDWLLEQLL